VQLLRCGEKWVKVGLRDSKGSAATTMFLGEFEHTLDEKNRLTLPARFRESFPDGLVVTRGMDGCLYAYARSDWQSLVDSRLANLDLLSRDDRMIQRYFFSAAVEAAPDKQGRIMLPASLVEHASLGREVVVAGVHDHLEIWDRAVWRTLVEEVEGRAEHVAERLAAKRD
jgi:MraZ protein